MSWRHVERHNEESASSQDTCRGAPGPSLHRSDSGVVRPSFSWREVSGSLGDLGLFIPLVVAVTVACDLDLGVVLVCAGVMNILTGLYFGQPLPVQPMKAIAAVAITEGLTRDELTAAGVAMGVLMIAVSPIAKTIDRLVPHAVVRGIQLGVGLKLAAKGVAWTVELPLWAWDSLVTAALLGGMMLTLMKLRRPALLWLFPAGFVLIWFENPSAFEALRFGLPDFGTRWPGADGWAGGVLRGALPQLPLTTLNSVIAVCALSERYFPGRGISPTRMASSVGLMNLATVPFGGIPMCHGAGGLAAQHRFGARTGGSIIALGTMKLAAGLFLGLPLLTLLGDYPMAILGPMLVVAGVELARSVQDILSRKRDLGIAMTTACFILGASTLFGFAAGCLMAAGMRLMARLGSRTEDG